MRRPGLNKNEAIRINIEQRYFLEDRISKRGKLKVCKEGQQREKSYFLFFFFFSRLRSGVWLHLYVTQFICKALSQLVLQHPARQGHTFHCAVCMGVCVCYYVNCVFTAVVRQQNVVFSSATLFMGSRRGLAPCLALACFV